MHSVLWHLFSSSGTPRTKSTRRVISRPSIIEQGLSWLMNWTEDLYAIIRRGRYTSQFFWVLSTKADSMSLMVLIFLSTMPSDWGLLVIVLFLSIPRMLHISRKTWDSKLEPLSLQQTWHTKKGHYIVDKNIRNSFCPLVPCSKSLRSIL